MLLSVVLRTQAIRDTKCGMRSYREKSSYILENISGVFWGRGEGERGNGRRAAQRTPHLVATSSSDVGGSWRTQRSSTVLAVQQTVIAAIRR